MEIKQIYIKNNIKINNIQKYNAWNKLLIINFLNYKTSNFI